MCGSSHLLTGALVGAALNESRHGGNGHQTTAAPAPPSITQEIKLMYARGDITSGSYHRLLEMDRSGELSWDDLRQLSQGGAPAPVGTKPAARERDADIVRSLNKLYTHRSALEQSLKETESVLATLEADVTRLKEQAETARARAETSANSDEASARAYLAIRQDVLERVAVLEERIAALRQDLAQIQDLEMELATREAELKALESRSKLAELEASIREDLLVG
jgi:prefoldin subunit 5